MANSSLRRSGGSEQYDHARGDYPYVLMVGQSGSGKSEIAKKLAHPEFVSSNIKGSGTQTSDLFWTYDRKMVICDVPEDLPGDDIFKEFIPLASALSFDRVSLILITVKVNKDVKTSFENIELYYNGLVHLIGSHCGGRLLGVMVTDVDEITIQCCQQLKRLVKNRLRFRGILFCRKTPQSNYEKLLQGIGEICGEKENISPFLLKFYHPKTSKHSTVIETSEWRQSTEWKLNQIVKEFKDIAQSFDDIRYEEENKLMMKDSTLKRGNILFEFQAWMEVRINIARNKFADSQKFTFHGEAKKSEDTYIVTMVNQIRHILFDLKMETKKYIVERDVDPRRCPYCYEIWTKDILEGCDGSTTCGNYRFSEVDFNEVDYNKLGKYAFLWTNITRRLDIRLSQEIHARSLRDNNARRNQNSLGCGKSIKWQEMPQIDLEEGITKVLYTVLSSTKPELGQNLEKGEQPMSSLDKIEQLQETHDDEVITESDKKLNHYELCGEFKLRNCLTERDESSQKAEKLQSSTGTTKIVQQSYSCVLNSESKSSKNGVSDGVEVKMHSDEPEENPNTTEQPKLSEKQIDSDSSSVKLNAATKEKGNYIVFIGDVGVGKSTVVGKLTGKQMESGDNKMSITRTSTAHWSYDGTVILSDTPGSNSVQDQLQHNEEIAAAFNYRPISRVFVVVKADIRIANVMRVVEKYSERLLSLPDENIGVLVTHMDTVSWTPRDLQQRLIDEYGIECVLFCGKETPKEILMGEIRKSCGRTISFRVNDKNFSELFKINNKMVKILKDTSKEIDGFTELKRQFKIIIEKDNALSKPAFIRDFQSWLQTQITEAEDRLAKSNNFTFSGEDAAKERGYIANLTNQIIVVFNEITSLNVVNDRANVGGNAGSEDYVFKWRNESEYFTFNTVERKEEGENMSLPIPRGTPQICRPKESETSNMVKRESLPPITPYSNDQEKNISRSLEGEHANHHCLQIAPNKSQNSGTAHFTFDLLEESSTGDSTIRFDESKKLVKNVDLSPTFKQQIPARKTQSSELKLDHPSIDKNDESRNEFPLFSFNIVFDQRNDGHDKRMYTLQLYNKDLKVIPMETQRDDRHDKSLKSSVPLEKDWSPGHWRNISVSFDNMDALSSHTGGQDIMETAGSSTDSGTPTRTYRKKSMLNQKPDNSKTVQERTRSKESIMSYYAHNFISGFRKNKNNIDDKRFKERQGPSALNSDQAEYNKGSFDNDGNFHVNIKNTNPDTPLFGIIFTPTPSTSSSRSGIDKLATALNDKCLLSNNQSKSTSLTCSRSSSRTTNLSGVTGSRDSERKTSRARRSTKSRRSLI